MADENPKQIARNVEPLPSLFGSARHALYAGGLFLLAVLIVFGDLLFAGGDRILSLRGDDIFNSFVGFRQFAISEITSGNLPLWNPHVYSGAPFLGGFQAALLYPPNVIHLILPMPQAINFIIALHVWMAGFFAYLWMARRGLHWVAGVVAGLVFMFGGATYLHIVGGHLSNTCTMPWAPLIFLCIDDLILTRSLRGAWWGAGAIAMQIFAGHPQLVYYTALAAAVYAVIMLVISVAWAPSPVFEISDREDTGGAPVLRHSRRLMKPVAGLALMVAGGIALSAVQLFTGLAASREGLRSEIPIEMARLFPFSPQNLLTIVFPDFFGRAAEGTYWGDWTQWEESLFIGVAAVVLAVYGAIRDPRPLRSVALAMSLGCIVVALGSHTPIHALLCHVLPGFGNLRGVGKFAFLALLFLAVLAGCGMDRLLRSKSLRKIPVIVLAIASLVVLVSALLIRNSASSDFGFWASRVKSIDWQSESHHFGSIVHAPPTAGIIGTSGAQAARALLWCGIAAAAMATLWILSTRKRFFVYGIAALVAVELLTFARSNRPWFDFNEVKNTELQLQQAAQQMGPDARLMSGAASVAMGAGIDDAWGDDPMVLLRYAKFMTYGLGYPAAEVERHGYPFFTAPSPTWGMVRVRYVFASSAMEVKGPQLDRAQLIENVKVIEDPAAAMQAIEQPAFDPRKTAVVEQNLAFNLQPAASGPPGTVAVKDLSSDELEITADVARPCLLLITDNYAAGWRARSLEMPAKSYDVLRADYILRGIPLGPGRHHILMEYLPAAYVWGKWTSIAACVVYFAIAFAIVSDRLRSAKRKTDVHSHAGNERKRGPGSIWKTSKQFSTKV